MKNWELIGLLEKRQTKWRCIDGSRAVCRMFNILQMDTCNFLEVFLLDMSRLTYNLQLVEMQRCRDVVAVAVVDVAVAVADGGAVPVILILDLMKYFYVRCSER